MTNTSPSSTRGGPLSLLLRFFSSVKLGVFLLVVLFVYSWIGSAGLFYPTSPLIFDKPWAHSMPRQWRIFELTEFEWFHTWFFDINIALIVLNVTVTTLRRIPLTILSAGVWSIHAGIVILALGSVIYFGSKVEGDAPVVRRQIVVNADGLRKSIPALPGNTFRITDASGVAYELTVASVEPQRAAPGTDSTAFGVTVNGEASFGRFTVDLTDGQPAQAFLSRRITVRDGDAIGTLPVQPGAAATVGDYQLQVADIQPDWTLISGPDAGGTAFGVVVRVSRPGQAPFMRQLLDQHPEFTEDFIPGRGRVVKLDEFGGRKLVDDRIELELVRDARQLPFTLGLAPLPQKHFWVKDSSAIMVREIPPGADPAEIGWWEYPINHLPRYNDYVQRLDEVWLYPPPVREISDNGEETPPKPVLEPHPINISIPMREGPLAEIGALNVTGFLRYAALQDRNVPGARLNPYAQFVVRSPQGPGQRTELWAFDPARKQGLSGIFAFDWIESESEFARYRRGWRQRELSIEIPRPAREPVRLNALVTDDMIAEDSAWRDIEGSDAQYRITSAFDNLGMTDGAALSVLVVEYRPNPEASAIRRWVADDPARSRDVDANDADGHSMRAVDPSVRMTYDPGVTARVVLVGGEGIQPRLFTYALEDGSQLNEFEVSEGFEAPLFNDFTIELTKYMPRSSRETRPAIIPPNQRDRNVDIGRFQQWVQVEIPDGSTIHRRWLKFHKYSFRDLSEALPGLGEYRPERITLSDGRRIELLFSRERYRMKYPVILDDFRLLTHTGGFTGQTNTVRDWESHVRFIKPDGELSEDHVVRTNGPASWKGLWYFQSFWDPPRQSRGMGEPDYKGLSFTGLGIGNRRGVYIQLFGCCLSVGGMIYAFYIKPIVRRRRQERVYAEVAAAKQTPIETAAAPREEDA
ncbi:MAG: hypothetical protein RIB58_04310 [Phycisphaerales bacterium]